MENIIPLLPIFNYNNDLIKKLDINAKFGLYEVFYFEEVYGNITPIDFGMIIICGYSRPNEWLGDTYYLGINYDGIFYIGVQINGALTPTWYKSSISPID